eukprot:Stramenopile-MAST_4_protein_1568
MMNAIEWYPKPLELLNIPQDILKRAEARHKANKEHRAQVIKIKKYINSTFKFFEVAKYEKDEQEDIFELFEDGFERRRGEKMKHWVTRIIEGIDAGELPFMNPEALRKILISVPDFDATEEEIASANSFIETANLEPLYTLLSELEYHLENTKSDVTEDAFASGFSYKSKGHRRENVRAWVKRLANSIAQGKHQFKTLDGLENVFTRVGRVKAGGATPTRKELVDAMNNPQQLRRLFQRLSDFLGGSGGSTNLRL